MPLQHIDDEMLRRMRRETDGQYIRDLILRIRAGIPGIALRTTFIVGFPGETETRFQNLLEFIRSTRFERLGVFSYSKEDGTVAGKMEAQISAKTRQNRKLKAMETQQAIAAEISQGFVGRTIKVLVENKASSADLEKASVSSWEHGLIRNDVPTSQIPKGSYWIGRGEADAPDIDGRVYVRGKVLPGEFVEVKVLGHTVYDLVAKPV
jgi:ribosomal protein S12 methylthiotransferase